MVLGVTALGAIAVVVAPQVAASTPPHSTLTGTLGEAESILLNNLRAIAVPFGLILLGFPARRAGRITGTIVVWAWLAVNCVPVGIALERWQGRLLPYLPHLPLEWAALACSTCAWLVGRDTIGNRRNLIALVLATAGLLTVAACLETWATPHRPAQVAVTANTVSASRCESPSDRTSPRRGSVVVCLRPDFAPARASRFKVAALPSPHQRSVPLGRLAGAVGLHQPPPAPTGGIE
jgi:hypothetical protein